MRLHGAWLATAVAEYFRDCGKSVLLIMGLPHPLRPGTA